MTGLIWFILIISWNAVMALAFVIVARLAISSEGKTWRLLYHVCLLIKYYFGTRLYCEWGWQRSDRLWWGREIWTLVINTRIRASVSCVVRRRIRLLPESTTTRQNPLAVDRVVFTLGDAITNNNGAWCSLVPELNPSEILVALMSGPTTKRTERNAYHQWL
jgi:hypothetical protein